MKLINTASWARTLAPYRPGLMLPWTGSAPRVCLSEMDVGEEAGTLQCEVGDRQALAQGGLKRAGAQVNDTEEEVLAQELRRVDAEEVRCRDDEEGTCAVVDEMELGESASSWVAVHCRGGGSWGAGAQIAGACVKGAKVWSLFYSKNKRQWFYHNNLTNEKVWKAPPVEGWLIKTRDAEVRTCTSERLRESEREGEGGMLGACAYSCMCV